MSQKRQAFVWFYVGQTGSGKTSTAIQTCKDWRRANKGKKIIGFDPHGDFEAAGLLTHTIEENDKNWAEILMTRICVNCNKVKHPDKPICVKCGKDVWRFKFQDSLLILDDYRSLLTADTLPRDVLRLFALKRKLGLDIIFSTHNPALLIERASYYLTTINIFSTESDSGDFSKKISRYVPCQKGANIINAYVMELGGVDDERYRSMYPNFPYVMVTNNSNGLIFMNMDEKIVNKLKGEGKI